MKFDEIKEQSYFRDRNDENYELDKYAYFEELRVLKKEEDVMRIERVHIYIDYEDSVYADVNSAKDIMIFKKERWKGWEKIHWIQEEEVYRRALKYLFDAH